MQLEHSFIVPVGIDEAWKVLLDIERIGPCMPGATIETIDGDDFTGSVKVKLGPINLTYKGKATFLEKDEAAHRAVIEARGRDARGNGTAAANVTANLAESTGETTVVLVTDLDITGKPAQFGRGVMVDVGNKLIGQFASCLADKLGAGGTPAETEAIAPTAAAAPTAAVVPAAETAEAIAPTAAAQAVESPAALSQSSPSPSTHDAGEPSAGPAPAVQPTTRVVSTPEAEPIDLLQSAGPAVAKRLAPVVAAVLAAVAVFVVIRRHRG